MKLTQRRLQCDAHLFGYRILFNLPSTFVFYKISGIWILVLFEEMKDNHLKISKHGHITKIILLCLINDKICVVHYKRFNIVRKQNFRCLP